MSEDFMNALRDLSDSSDDDNLAGGCEGPGSRAEGDVPGSDSGDEQQAQRAMLNPTPDANAQELRKVRLSICFISLGHRCT